MSTEDLILQFDSGQLDHLFLNQNINKKMGLFSWITQDTREAIRSNGSVKSKRKAFMHDNKGNIWEENDYEGYGVFGGKDFFQLLAEINEAKGLNGDVDNDRLLGIDLYYGKDPFISPNLTRAKDWKWVNRPPENDPNQGLG
jgi:hypothetical protein